MARSRTAARRRFLEAWSRRLSRWLRRVGVRRAPRLPLVGWALLGVATLALANACVQVARKPTELLGLVAPSSTKTPAATWEAYGDLFEAHATPIVTAELLAALAQAESAGDPLARTYWRWSWSWNPFEIYAPASSAVGLLQITDGTFEEARGLCIHGHEVARDGPWLDPTGCWFNGLYARWVPGHAIEMTSAYLHVAVLETLAGSASAGASAADRRRLAALIHLCGRARGALVARRGLRVLPGERCGDHDLARYLAEVAALERTFARVASER